MLNAGHPEGSWYRASIDEPPRYPALDGDLRVDVAIVGGGYTGLGAALELTQKGVNVAVLEAAEIGSGASGRNGGQMHMGQRLDPETLEQMFGEDVARQFWDMAMDARHSLDALMADHGIECDVRNGLIHAWHKPRFEADDRAYANFVQSRYGYNKLSLLSRDAVNAELGTDVYHGGLFDAGGGHLHPLKLAIGMAKAAAGKGAQLFERSQVVRVEDGATPVLHTANGRVTCDTVLLCGNGYMEGLSEAIDSHVMPINNFILTTAPLKDNAILRSNYAAADSRFVVNYWRKTRDNRLLFGGGENYTPWFPKDIAGFVRRNMLKIYPQLADVEITHAWGGTLAITMSRAPFVRQLSPNIFVSAGYSGQGVVLAPYFGRLLARAVIGNARDVELLGRLPTPAFFGGRALRWPALVAGLSYYALRDRL
ncbi:MULTISPECIES: FAD-binding oxidoreductase [Asticcacaulis]|uniref:NAD(P)/FAD-dependent oxidoreductase n=1 Tax=Asticcacaulis TaxID=76890 RepID=UPI001AE3F06B|nr:MULTISPECIES: FAD-binding oxidoreductase [Asticcacaulis]MBP2161429.1 gamma-glutamylputrescine oxidase [Asticcacaulis solisilvae]MDR6802474.1 gamma-glutamylputrescine oxidase [Asticcacaulis sp. BE141]